MGPYEKPGRRCQLPAAAGSPDAHRRLRRGTRVAVLDADGRACSLSTSAVSFIQLAAASLAKCSIQAVIDSFDINVCAVGMRPRGFGEVDYVVAPDVEQAIRSKTMRLRPQHNTTPGRVEKYQSRGFTLLE